MHWFNYLKIILLVHLINFASARINLINEDFETTDVLENFINAVQNRSLISETKISEFCVRHLIKLGFAAVKLESWALHMLDASTKTLKNSGLLNGNRVQLGDYDECLSVSDGEEISGKYCLAIIPLFKRNPGIDNVKSNLQMRISLNKVASAFALCVPNSCSNGDLMELSKLVFKRFKVEFYDELCDVKTERAKFTAGDITALSILSIIFLLVTLSTAYEFIIYYRKQRPTPILITFSAYANSRKILRTGSEPGQIACLHGIRVISMMWIVLSHKYSFIATLPKQNSAYVFSDWAHANSSMIVLGATVSVDTFLVLSGMLVAYGFMTSASKGSKFNILVYYLHRIIRLTPLLVIVVLIQATFLRHMGNGPLWKSTMDRIKDPCDRHWWKTLLYIQNYANSANDICIRQSWYLAVDMQLYLLSPIILVPLKKWPKIGLISTVLFLIASLISSFIVGWFGKYYGHIMTNIIGGTMRDFMDYYYYATHTRAGPWLMGILLGYLMHDIQANHRKIKISKCVSLMLWMLALALLLACLLAGQNTFKSDYEYDRFLNSFFIAFHRPGWSLGVLWVIFACFTGHGGPINYFLSLPIFQVLSKLTYSVFLIHITIVWAILGQTRVTPYFKDLEMVHGFWGDFVYSYAASLVFTVALESPIVALEKIIFGEKERKPRGKVCANGNPTKEEENP